MRFLPILHAAVAALKRLPRTGWQQRGVPAPESVASHSFGVALLTLVLAERRAAAGDPVDTLVALRMALLHDLPEAGTGDLTPGQRAALFGPDLARSRAGQVDAERRVLIQLLEDAPEDQRTRWQADWEAYREGTSLEARLVHTADRLDCVLQAVTYRRECGSAALGEFGRLIDTIDDPALATALRRLWED